MCCSSLDTRLTLCWIECQCVRFAQAVKRRGRALGWLAALLAMYPGGPQLKPKGGGGLAAIARQKKLQARPKLPPAARRMRSALCSCFRPEQTPDSSTL